VKLPHRRQVLQLAAGTSLLSGWPRPAFPQAYPTRPVRIVAAFPPGGSHDIIARLTGQWLSEHLGRPFVVENRPGANGNIGTEAVVRSAPDGYTLLTVGSPHAVNASLYEKLNFDFLRDISPFAGVIEYPLVMAVNPSLPAHGVSEFIALAKTTPRKINMGSGGLGNPTLPSALEHIRAGKLRALAVTTATRSDRLPETPTIGEFVPGYEASDWVGFGAPKKTPADVIEALSRQVNAMVADPRMKELISELGGTVPSGDFGNRVRAEMEKWAKVVKFAGIKPE
jgi:tripartite-type tricarboxylate transporter receptor subunit TctC